MNNIPLQLRPVELRIVEGSKEQVQTGVNELLRQDWVMHGDLKINSGVYTQAMAKVALLPPPGVSMSDIAVPAPSPIIGRQMR